MIRFFPCFLTSLYRKGTQHSNPLASTKAFALTIRPYETRSTNHCLFPESTFSTDTPPLFSWMEGVQEVSLALGHDEPVSVGCPLYNEALAVKGCLILSSNVISRGQMKNRMTFLFKNCQILTTKVRIKIEIKDFQSGNLCVQVGF